MSRAGVDVSNQRPTTSSSNSVPRRRKLPIAATVLCQLIGTPSGRQVPLAQPENPIMGIAWGTVRVRRGASLRRVCWIRTRRHRADGLGVAGERLAPPHRLHHQPTETTTGHGNSTPTRPRNSSPATKPERPCTNWAPGSVASGGRSATSSTETAHQCGAAASPPIRSTPSASTTSPGHWHESVNTSTSTTPPCQPSYENAASQPETPTDDHEHDRTSRRTCRAVTAAEDCVLATHSSADERACATARGLAASASTLRSSAVSRLSWLVPALVTLSCPRLTHFV